MLRSKTLTDMIESFQCRRAGVLEFLSSIKPDMQVSVIALVDPFGPTITDPNIKALVVSSETMSGLAKINDLREGKGMSPLVGLVIQRSSAGTLSSTFIREFEARHEESGGTVDVPDVLDESGGTVDVIDLLDGIDYFQS